MRPLRSLLALSYIAFINSAFVLTLYLLKLFCFCLLILTLPFSWKSAYIQLVPSNYHSICLSCRHFKNTHSTLNRKMLKHPSPTKLIDSMD